MDRLLPAVNRLQDALTLINSPHALDLPQIVVVGSQSSGKSSVLEHIVGRDFLPRGSGIVTRRPLVLQLVAIGAPDRQDAVPVDAADWGEFLHLPGRKFTNFEEIRDEIVRDTDRVTGGRLAISPQPINLKIYSSSVLNLTLVDLPGITKLPVGDQPQDIETQIRDMILSYITQTNAVILAVTPANTDIANSDALKLARLVDPLGKRTLGVLTKMDIMDRGTDASDVLAGRLFASEHGFVGVVNRSQRDIDARLPIADALRAEAEFFEAHPAYKGRSNVGTRCLARKLSTILMTHIQACLPGIRQSIADTMSQAQTDVDACGDAVEGVAEKGHMLLSVISDFCHGFRTAIDGSTAHLPSTELSGGARISFIFHHLFAGAVGSMDPLVGLTDEAIRTVLYNASGSSPALFISSASFEVLIKKQIGRLEQPCIQCVNHVHDELVRIAESLERASGPLQRFGGLRERLHAEVLSFLKAAVGPAKGMASNVIRAEIGYINTAHPDFITGHKALAFIQDKISNAKQLAEQQLSQAGTPNPTPTKGKDGKKAPDAPNSVDGLQGQGSAGGSFFGSFFGRKRAGNDAQQHNVEKPPAVLRPEGSMSEREIVEIEVVKLLMRSYFGIVKKTVQDMVPKSTMLFLVSHAVEQLQSHLVRALYREETFVPLMRENEAITERRAQAVRLVDMLRRADAIVAEAMDSAGIGAGDGAAARPSSGPYTPAR